MTRAGAVAKNRSKIEVLAEPEWIERVETEAKKLGLTKSAYVRMVVTQAMDRAEEDRKPRRER